MYSEPGDFIGGGMQRVYTQANSSTTLSGTEGFLTVNISSDMGDDWTMNFAAPPGENLQPGVYTNVGRAEFRGSGQAGIDIFGDGAGCNTDSGLFQVEDIGTDAGGDVNRLWIVYQQNCEGGEPALFGEVRLGEPAGGALSSAPSLVRWPEHNFGTAETTVPVEVTSATSTTIQSVALGGTDLSDFAIRADACTKVTLGAGGGCDVYVQPTPRAAGTRTATLDVTTTSGQSVAVPLQVWTEGGTTKLAMTSVGGDFVGGDQSYHFAPTDATILASGTPELVQFVLDSGTQQWDGAFTPAAGGIVATGMTYFGAQRYPFQGNSPGLTIYGDGRGCNTSGGRFTVTDATFSLDGQLETFGVRFAQRCTDPGSTGALYGTFDWDLGATTAPPPWGVPTS